MQRRSGGSAASVFVLGLAGLATLAAACGSEPEMDWDPDVVRVVAERNASLLGYPMIVWRRVLDQDVDRPGQAMPWGAHQALITAGYLVVDSAAVRPDTATLGFESIRRTEDDWRVVTALIKAGGAEERGMDRHEWVVRCVPECVIADSTFIGSARVGRGR